MTFDVDFAIAYLRTRKKRARDAGSNDKAEIYRMAILALRRFEDAQDKTLALSGACADLRVENEILERALGFAIRDMHSYGGSRNVFWSRSASNMRKRYLEAASEEYGSFAHESDLKNLGVS